MIFKKILPIFLIFPSGVFSEPIIKNNKVFVGASSFAYGVKSFPRYDSKNGIGYNTFVRTVKKVATNELYTFPEKTNKDLIKNSIGYLLANGHKVFHEIHVLNGPAIRGASDYFVNSLYNRKMYNKEFKARLKTDKYVQQRVLRLFKKAVTHAKSIQEMGAAVVICPELEDNQNFESFEILLKLLRKAGWKDTRNTVRNSIYNEYPTRSKMRYEVHAHSADLASYYLSRMKAGDIINNDGNSFRFNGETNTSKTISQSQIERMILETGKRKVIFYAWYSPLQGYDNSDQSYNGEYTNRKYTISRKNRKMFGAMLSRRSVKESFQ